LPASEGGHAKESPAYRRPTLAMLFAGLVSDRIGRPIMVWATPNPPGSAK